MYNLVAFVNAIIIASSVVSSVYSFPSVELGAGLDSILSIVQSTCYETHAYPRNRELKTFDGYAVDSEGRSCSEKKRDPNFEKLFDKTNFETNYANETAEFCPPWSEFKQCLTEHVNSDKCSADEKQVVLESENFSIVSSLAEQLCNPSNAPQFRNLWKDLLNEELLDCVFGPKLRDLHDECDQKKYDQAGHHARFQDLGIYFECMKPGVRTCANGDHVKEVISVRLWEGLYQAFQDGHRAFWNY